MAIELYYPVDRAFRDYNPRLPTGVIRELQDAHNVNCCDECDDWLDQELTNEISHDEEIDEVEFFNRYVF